MSIVEPVVRTGCSGEASSGVEISSEKRRTYHRLATLRRLQGISLATVARCMKMDVSTVRWQEKETRDLPLSVLCQWRKVLGVPISELFVEAGDALSRPLVERAQLVRLMKTAMSLLELADCDATRKVGQDLVDQLRKVMPELGGVGAWHAVGERRRLDELGIAAIRSMPDRVYARMADE